MVADDTTGEKELYFQARSIVSGSCYFLWIYSHVLCIDRVVVHWILCVDHFMQIVQEMATVLIYDGISGYSGGGDTWFHACY